MKKELKMIVKETKNECTVKFRDGWKFKADRTIVRDAGPSGMIRLHQYVMFNDKMNGVLFINVLDGRDVPAKNGITLKRVAKFMEKHYSMPKTEHLVVKIINNIQSAIEQYYPACLNFSFTNMGTFTITTDLGVTLTNIKVKDDSMINDKKPKDKIEKKIIPNGETVDPENGNLKQFKGTTPAEEVEPSDGQLMADGYKEGM